jgi:hypothetical protein
MLQATRPCKQSNCLGKDAMEKCTNSPGYYFDDNYYGLSGTIVLSLDVLNLNNPFPTIRKLSKKTPTEIFKRP